MATIDARLPPLDGSLNGLPGFVDFHAKHNPNRALYVFPYTDLNSDELRTTSYSDFAQATHRVAHTLRPKREGPDGLVVAIIANVDSVLYHAMLVGLIRAGLVPFAMSPRNSALAIASMMERTQCHHIVSQPAFAGIISEVRSALPSGYSVQIDEVPSLSSVFPSLALTPPDHVTEPEPYPSPLQDPVPTSVALYLHSSGSTGHPKPVPQTHEFLRNWCRFPVVLHGRLHAVGWGAHALPPFHTMAIAVQLLAPLVSGCPTSLFPPRAVEGDPPVIPTPQNTILNARKTSCGILATVPSFVEAWAHNDEDVKYLASLKLLIFAGGPLSKVNGDKLVARGVHLSAGYGATETGSIMKMPFVNTNVPDPDAKSPEDWE
ncbi:hypothetical protein EVJ58_g8698 [Rhodofomes roseus]|uniref:AMP-dependent synthetase/ligase domain-containing protein n=1 Tax=Rhodofomes roseus TaxID=34475 RepID=A0A4Y9XX94_9APHY|nr:hypothetical protein EVJ58_g8698 [Rhodofomes roseus]